MLKFFSKNSSVLAGSVIVAGTTILPLTTLAQTPPTVDSTVPNSPRLLVIQGQVRSIQGNIVIVKTPDLPPYCPPNRACLAIILAGPSFRVDISGATFQSASGTRLTPRPRLVVGDSVVVAGRLDTSVPPIVPAPALTPLPSVAPTPFKAVVVSKAVPAPTPTPTPTPVPAPAPTPPRL